MNDFPNLPPRSIGFDPKAPKARAAEKCKERAVKAIKEAEDNTLPEETMGPRDEPLVRSDAPPKRGPSPGARKRLPPGQNTVTARPVLDLGLQPAIDGKDWSMQIGGLQEGMDHIRLNDLKDWPQTEIEADIHCVTGWSRYDNLFSGITTQQLRDRLAISPRMTHVIIRSYDGYSTGLPIHQFFDPTVMLATHWDEKPLSRSHGGPVRLIVPQLYFWKSAKWIKQIWFTDQRFKGYWESRGYHDGADPWKEERYGD